MYGRSMPFVWPIDINCRRDAHHAVLAAAGVKGHPRKRNARIIVADNGRFHFRRRSLAFLRTCHRGLAADRLKRCDARAHAANSCDEAPPRVRKLCSVHARTSAVRGSRDLVPVQSGVSGNHFAAVRAEPVSVFYQALKHVVAVRNGGPANPECISDARLSLFECFSRSGPARRNECQSSRDRTE